MRGTYDEGLFSCLTLFEGVMGHLTLIQAGSWRGNTGNRKEKLYMSAVGFSSSLTCALSRDSCVRAGEHLRRSPAHGNRGRAPCEDEHFPSRGPPTVSRGQNSTPLQNKV